MKVTLKHFFFFSNEATFDVNMAVLTATNVESGAQQPNEILVA